MRGKFPASPDDGKPLPAASTLQKGAKLSDIAAAHEQDRQTIDLLTALVQTWRDWHAKQSNNWSH